jgi:glycosyltransferase involved in cell wall biosynthesis
METYCWELTQRLGEYSNLEIIALPGQEGGAPPTPTALVGFGFSAALRLLRKSKLQLLHVGDVASWPLAWIAAIRHPHIRIMLSAHGSDLSYAKRKGWRSILYANYLRLGARLLPNARVIANSGWIAGLAKDVGFTRTVQVPLATTFARSPARDNNGALLFAGRIAPAKGLAFIVEQVLPLLPPSVRLRVAGNIWDAEEARVLDSPRVDYLGSLPAEALAREYATAMCTLVPSLGPEGFGLTAVEAAAAGGVVIASNHSGLAEAIGPGLGFLEEAGNASAWARRILEVTSWNKEQREAFVADASARAAEFYNWDRVVRDTLAVYGEEMASSGA